MRILLKIVLILGLLLLVVVGAATYYINTGQYRSMLEDTVADNTGYELVIAGDVDLQIFPTLGLTLNDVRLTNPAVRQELLSTSTVLLRVDARALLGGQLLIQELLARNFHVNYYIDAEGNSIWTPPRQQQASRSTSSESDSDADSGDGSDSAVILSFDRIDIENTSIDYQDLSQGTRYQIDNFNLVSLDTNLNGRPFEISIDFDFENNGMSAPVPMAMRSSVTVDTSAGTINLADLQFSVTPLLLQGEINISNLDSAMQFSGNLQAQPFDVRGLLETLALAPATDGLPGSPAGERPLLSFATQFTGNGDEATTPSFTLRLDEADINVNASVRFASEFAPTNISYELMAGDLDLTPFMATGEQSPADSPAPGTAEEAPLPVDLLNAFNLLGSASIDSLTLGEMVFQDINLFTNIEDGVLDVEITPVTAFSGSLEGALRLDARDDTPNLDVDLSVQQFNLGDLSGIVSRFDGFAGALNMEVDHSSQGTTVSEMLNNLTGSSSFSVNNSSIDITLIKQVFTAIVALSPDGESIQQWPDVLRFSDLGGYISLQEGLQVNQDIKLRMDNFDITGSGGINLAEGGFDYAMLFTVLGSPHTQTIQINERYHDVSWPVQCTASFSDPVSQYCRPDFNQVRDIFAQLGSQAIRNRLDEAVTDQVPEDLQDAARGLLDSIFN